MVAHSNCRTERQRCAARVAGSLDPARSGPCAAALLALASGARADWIQIIGIGEQPALLGVAVGGLATYRYADGDYGTPGFASNRDP